ncbi:MAG: hypothetical protein ABSC01_10535 [Verrucomicrobiota bacterium]
MAETALGGTSNESKENDNMRLNSITAGRNRERVVDGAAKPTQRTGEPEAFPGAGVPERFRRLKWNEVVCHGDFVANERLGLEPWEGPGGFQAATFVKPIYRRKETGRFRPTATRKSKQNKNNP